MCIVLHPESLIVLEVIEEASRLLIMSCEAKQLNLSVHVNKNIRISADREAIVLVVRNLLSNAIKFSNPGGVIYVSATSAEGKVEISVQDEGVGMSEEQIRQLFDETRFTSTIGTAGEKGAGLGLRVSQHFLRMSGGHFQVDSKPGVGSKFTIILEDGDLR